MTRREYDEALAGLVKIQRVALFLVAEGDADAARRLVLAAVQIEEVLVHLRPPVGALVHGATS